MIQDNYCKNECVLKTIKLCRNVRYYDFNQLKVRPCGLLDFGFMSQFSNTEKQTEGSSTENELIYLLFLLVLSDVWSF